MSWSLSAEREKGYGRELSSKQIFFDRVRLLRKKRKQGRPKNMEEMVFQLMVTLNGYTGEVYETKNRNNSYEGKQKKLWGVLSGFLIKQSPKSKNAKIQRILF